MARPRTAGAVFAFSGREFVVAQASAAKMSVLPGQTTHDESDNQSVAQAEQHELRMATFLKQNQRLVWVVSA